MMPFWRRIELWRPRETFSPDMNTCWSSESSTTFVFSSFNFAKKETHQMKQSWETTRTSWSDTSVPSSSSVCSGLLWIGDSVPCPRLQGWIISRLDQKLTFSPSVAPSPCFWQVNDWAASWKNDSLNWKQCAQTGFNGFTSLSREGFSVLQLLQKLIGSFPIVASSLTNHSWCCCINRDINNLTHTHT